jgi:hypothetical protein
MTEQDLLNLGFERCDIDDEDEKFHYYFYDLNGESGCGSLLSNSNDELGEGEWKVYAWDINEDLVFDNVEDIKTYINVIEKNILTKEL